MRFYFDLRLFGYQIRLLDFTPAWIVSKPEKKSKKSKKTQQEG